MLSALMIVTMAAFIGAAAHASGPSKADYVHLEQIKQNQKILAKDRDVYNEFLKAKADNEAAVQAIGADGYTVDWKTMTLEPSFQ